MTRKVRTPGGLKALEAMKGPGAMLAARGGGALARWFMAVGVRGTERQEGRTTAEEAGAASWEGKPLEGRTPETSAGRNKPARRWEE
jgi:hypothetical protein